MTLLDLASIGNLVGGVAVLASLLYLAFQIRQSTKHTRALIYQGRIDRNVQQFLALAQTDMVAAAIVGNGGSPTPQAIQARQFLLQCGTYYLTWDDTFWQHEDNLISDERFADIVVGIKLILRTQPGVHRYFSQAPFGSSKFGAFMKGLLAETSSPMETDGTLRRPET